MASLRHEICGPNSNFVHPVQVALKISGDSVENSAADSPLGHIWPVVTWALLAGQLKPDNNHYIEI